MTRLALRPALEILERFTAPEAGFVARRTSSDSEVRLALSQRGIALLVPTYKGLSHEPDLRLEHLTLLSCTECLVIEEGVESHGYFGIVECTSEDSDVRSTFVDVLEWMLPSQGDISIEEARTIFERIARLMRQLDNSTRSDALGLWGELFLISQAKSPGSLARAWHISPTDRWDFAADSLRLEVKTTTSMQRKHHFSLDQLKEPSGSTVWVASVMTVASPSGPSVGELLDLVMGYVAPHERSRIAEVAISSLGSSWPKASQARFDELLAIDSLRIYRAGEVPRVANPPFGVTEVRFVVDLTDVPTLTDGLDGIEGFLGRVT